MFDDDLEPQKKPTIQKNLEPMSLDELKNYIQEMQTEIVRTEAEIKKKQAYMDAASSVFK